MSDHGFGPLYSAININRWLQQQELLVFRETKGDIRGRLVKLSQIIKWRRFVPESLRKRLRAPFDQAECLDWEHTKAYSGSPIEQGIYINTPERRKDGIVRSASEVEQIKQKIKDLLPQLKDPNTGKPAIEAVYEASELLTGPYVSEAPDLIYVPRDSAYLTNGGTPDYDLFDRGEYWIEGGYHHPDGVLIVQGPLVRQDIKVIGANIVDVAPTILHLFSLPIPKHLDGAVLGNLFDPDYLETHPVHFMAAADDNSEQNISAPAYSEAESEEIRSRLRDLGYLD
jgi:predicted AlkP superfamily phosphohydrolase/phosphomutase